MRTLLAIAALAALAAAPARAQARPDRWQITMQNDSLLWDIRLVSLDGDKLTYRQADSTGAVAVGEVKEMRLFQASELQMGTAGAAFGALSGSDDIVFDMTLLDFAERLRTVQQIFQKYPPQTGS
ncbi:MAG: hypothetical protein H6Q77_1526 [Gemmatimonadetes bacterium]|jgi:hypothetical protein|nr:hypothetical protein [Gemmatimonadota bacterium]